MIFKNIFVGRRYIFFITVVSNNLELGAMLEIDVVLIIKNECRHYKN